ncbi:MAG: hypothetical protein JWR26_3287 [Pedosphaera sp.]|nr:hypothetical protein [Pedosphaera sp.]
MLTAATASAQLIPVIRTATPPASGGGGDSAAPVISPDGRFVLFASTARNLFLGGNGNPIPAPLDVFLGDRTNGTTTLVSVNLAGTGGGNGDSVPVEISTYGQYALLECDATNLVAGDSNGLKDIFVESATTRENIFEPGGSINGSDKNKGALPGLFRVAAHAPRRASFTQVPRVGPQGTGNHLRNSQPSPHSKASRPMT